MSFFLQSGAVLENPTPGSLADMASSSVSQEDVEQDFQLLSRRSKIRTARARNPLAFSQRPGRRFHAPVVLSALTLRFR